MAKKTPFSLEDHKRVGERIKAIHAELKTLGIEINNAYPVGSMPNGVLRVTIDRLLSARVVMENQFYKDCPEQKHPASPY